MAEGSRRPESPCPFYHPRWPLLYHDNHLLGLYKPAGLLVQGDRSGDPNLLDLAKAWIKQLYHKPGKVYLGLVHRLDRPVAGVVLFARTSKGASRLSAQFRDHRVSKQYLAVVEGRLAPRRGTLNAYHLKGQHRSSRLLKESVAGARQARLAYEVLERSAHRSLVAVRLETGRKHQIRLQLAALGHPVLGDVRYGAAGPLAQQQIALLAQRLTVIHPTLREPLTLESPLPQGWPWTMTGSSSSRFHPPWDWKELVPKELIPARH